MKYADGKLDSFHIVSVISNAEHSALYPVQSPYGR